jgi:hypothetical protein
MSTKQGIEIAKAVEDTMLYANPTLHTVSDRLVDKLGGRGSFVGLHLRVGEARGGGEMFNNKPDATVTAVMVELDKWLESARKNATHGKKGKRTSSKNLKGLWKKVTDPNRKPDAKRKKSAKAAKIAAGGMIAVGSVPAPRNKPKVVDPAELAAEQAEAEAIAARDGKAPDIDEARPPRYNNIGNPLAPLSEEDAAGKAAVVEGEAAAVAPATADDSPKAPMSEDSAAPVPAAVVTEGEADAAVAKEGDSSAEASKLKKAPASHPLSPYLPADPSSVSDPESLLEICRHLHATAKDSWEFPIIYIATDALDARNNPSFRPIFEKYPCTFLLSDMFGLTDGLAKTKDVNFPAGSMVPSEVFTRKTAHLFIPLVDQIVVSQGKTFFGTPKSTFSTFASRLHHYWVQLGLHPSGKKGKGARGRAAKKSG